MTTPLDPSTVLCARLFNNACTDNHPLARVRYGYRRRMRGWTYIRHDDLTAATGHDLTYWQQLHTHAEAIVARIAELNAAGILPRVTDFVELHNYFDADTAWGAAIDDLDAEAWAHTQWLVTDLLRFPAPKGADR